MGTDGAAALSAGTGPAAADSAGTGTPGVTKEAVWKVLGNASFAVLSHVNAAGEPRSSGVVYGVADRRLFVAVAADGSKARQIASGDSVAVTVPVRRGGILALFLPIPPATITFHARATVHAAGSLDIGSVSRDLEKLVPEERKTGSCVLELAPEGRFLTYGIGVSLRAMADPGLALARVPVA
jgi:hypothetical protein